mmetsp:Transcript_111838/g.361057  ORF Transcript_111838/g.361057 Transcript_111838/m.361057 type:complete len:459 (-) Transcript_111838:12-1388(-)
MGIWVERQDRHDDLAVALVDLLDDPLEVEECDGGAVHGVDGLAVEADVPGVPLFRVVDPVREHRDLAVPSVLSDVGGPNKGLIPDAAAPAGVAGPGVSAPHPVAQDVAEAHALSVGLAVVLVLEGEAPAGPAHLAQAGRLEAGQLGVVVAFGRARRVRPRVGVGEWQHRRRIAQAPQHLVQLVGPRLPGRVAAAHRVEPHLAAHWDHRALLLDGARGRPRRRRRRQGPLETQTHEARGLSRSADALCPQLAPSALSPVRNANAGRGVHAELLATVERGHVLVQVVIGVLRVFRARSAADPAEAAVSSAKPRGRLVPPAAEARGFGRGADLLLPDLAAALPAPILDPRANALTEAVRLALFEGTCAFEDREVRGRVVGLAHTAAGSVRARRLEDLLRPAGALLWGAPGATARQEAALRAAARPGDPKEAAKEQGCERRKAAHPHPPGRGGRGRTREGRL